MDRRPEDDYWSRDGEFNQVAGLGSLMAEDSGRHPALVAAVELHLDDSFGAEVGAADHRGSGLQRLAVRASGAGADLDLLRSNHDLHRTVNRDVGDGQSPEGAMYAPIAGGA